MLHPDDPIYMRVRQERNCLWLRRVTWACIGVLLAVGVNQAMGG
ncbi:hypothetical protein CURE108131_23025 [Cupriavidus respiraculi]|uniref:Uncharacterized protein n=1 Tax=Cupriavidus respiraculi TaxID=195930 RepID=A0ABN7YJF9_9BURK|nr:hypothetical protein [Cupriavidus respiraculi]CAG9172486.1 hypothetical protein LMG21510_01990 [Cupriavidus respiraculi]